VISGNSQIHEYKSRLALGGPACEGEGPPGDLQLGLRLERCRPLFRRGSTFPKFPYVFHPACAAPPPPPPPGILPRRTRPHVVLSHTLTRAQALNASRRLRPKFSARWLFSCPTPTPSRCFIRNNASAPLAAAAAAAAASDALREPVVGLAVLVRERVRELVRIEERVDV
jgi:hypothetical protein